MSRNGTSHGVLADIDPVRFYLDQTSQVQLLKTRAAEAKAAYRIERMREHWRELLLRSDVALHYGAAILRHATYKNQSPAKFLDPPSTLRRKPLETTMPQLKERLPETIRSIHRILVQTLLQFNLLRGGSPAAVRNDALELAEELALTLPEEEQAEHKAYLTTALSSEANSPKALRKLAQDPERLMELITDRRQRAVRLMEECGIKMSYVHDWHNETFKPDLKKLKLAISMARSEGPFQAKAEQFIQQMEDKYGLYADEASWRRDHPETPAPARTLANAAKHLGRRHESYITAKNELVLANTKLVVSIAKAYRKRAAKSGMEFMELVQAGNIGLMKAIDKFEWRKGHKFSTYATWWIKQQIAREIYDNGRAIRIPEKAQQFMSSIRNFAERFLQENGREATHEELAKELGTTKEEIIQLQKLYPGAYTLDGGDDSHQSWGRICADVNAESLLDLIQQNLLKEEISEMLQKLSYRERQVVILRNGIGGGYVYTLEEVGKVFKVSRERIRQIEIGAYKKLSLYLRAPSLFAKAEAEAAEKEKERRKKRKKKAKKKKKAAKKK